MSDASDPVSREVLERLVRVLGPDSTAARTLEELDRRVKLGEHVCAYQYGSRFCVAPAPRMRVTI